MLVNVATINKRDDGIYYANWYDNNANLCWESNKDPAFLESKLINELGVTKVIFGQSYWK